MSSTTVTSSPSYISSSSSSNNADAWRKTVAICVFMLLIVAFLIARIFQQYCRRMNAKKLDAAHGVDLEAAIQRTQSFDWDEKRCLSGNSVTCPPPAYITTTSSLDGDSGAITPEQRLRALDTFFGGAPIIQKSSFVRLEYIINNITCFHSQLINALSISLSSVLALHVRN